MYIDLFIIQNLIYDYLILNGVAILTDEKMRLSRLSLGLISSLVLSTLLFMMDFTTLVGLVPFVMLAIVFSKQNISLQEKKPGTNLKFLLTVATSKSSRKFLSSTEKEITATAQIQFLGRLCAFLLSRTSGLELPDIQTEITAVLERLG